MSPPSPSPTILASSISPAPARTSAILDAHQNPMGAEEFPTSNSWVGPSPAAGQWLIVYAGLSKAPGQTGPAVLVYAEAADPNAPDQYTKRVGLFTDSAAAGPLSVVSASTGVLTLSADPTAPGGTPGGKTRVTFDLATDTFG